MRLNRGPGQSQHPSTKKKSVHFVEKTFVTLPKAKVNGTTQNQFEGNHHGITCNIEAHRIPVFVLNYFRLCVQCFCYEKKKQIISPNKNGHAPPPLESGENCQCVNPYCLNFSYFVFVAVRPQISFPPTKWISQHP